MLAAMNLLGVKSPTYVTGYGGAGPIRLAFERAEINFTQETASAFPARCCWVREGWTTILYQVRFLDGKGNVVKDPVWKDLGIDTPRSPKFFAPITGKEPSGPAWDAEKALIGGYSLTRMMAIGAKTPPALTRVAPSVSGMGKDQAFLAEGPRAKAPCRAWCRRRTWRAGATLPRQFSKRQKKRRISSKNSQHPRI